MTENECIKSLNGIYPKWCSEKEEYEMAQVAIQALEEIQQYRAIEAELREKYHANVDIKMLMQHFIETIFKGEKHEGFCILTNEDAKMWGAYRAIGTVEECGTAVERMKPRKPIVEQAGYPNGEWAEDYKCPRCGSWLISKDMTGWFAGKHYKGCPDCLQAIDWSE